MGFLYSMNSPRIKAVVINPAPASRTIIMYKLLLEYIPTYRIPHLLNTLLFVCLNPRCELAAAAHSCFMTALRFCSSKMHGVDLSTDVLGLGGDCR